MAENRMCGIAKKITEAHDDQVNVARYNGELFEIISWGEPEMIVPLLMRARGDKRMILLLAEVQRDERKPDEVEGNLSITDIFEGDRLTQLAEEFGE